MQGFLYAEPLRFGVHRHMVVRATAPRYDENRVAVKLRLSPELREQVREAAIRADRSMNAVIRVAVLEHLARENARKRRRPTAGNHDMNAGSGTKDAGPPAIREEVGRPGVKEPMQILTESDDHPTQADRLDAADAHVMVITGDNRDAFDRAEAAQDRLLAAMERMTPDELAALTWDAPECAEFLAAANTFTRTLEDVRRNRRGFKRPTPTRPPLRRPRPRGAGRPRRRACSNTRRTSRGSPDDESGPAPAALVGRGRP